MLTFVSVNILLKKHYKSIHTKVKQIMWTKHLEVLLLKNISIANWEYSCFYFSYFCWHQYRMTKRKPKVFLWKLCLQVLQSHEASFYTSNIKSDFGWNIFFLGTSENMLKITEKYSFGGFCALKIHYHLEFNT